MQLLSRWISLVYGRRSWWLSRVKELWYSFSQIVFEGIPRRIEEVIVSFGGNESPAPSRRLPDAPDHAGLSSLSGLSGLSGLFGPADPPGLSGLSDPADPDHVVQLGATTAVQLGATTAVQLGATTRKPTFLDTPSRRTDPPSAGSQRTRRSSPRWSPAPPRTRTSRTSRSEALLRSPFSILCVVHRPCITLGYSTVHPISHTGGATGTPCVRPLGKLEFGRGSRLRGLVDDSSHSTRTCCVPVENIRP